MYYSAFCNKCGSSVKIFEIDVVKKESGLESINVYSSCSNTNCEASSDIVIQNVTLADLVFAGKYTDYKSKDEVLAKWNIHTTKKRDEGLKRLEQIVLQHCKDRQYESEK